MRRIHTPNRAIDLNGAGKDGWRSGNKAANIPPTENSGEFMNMIQEELAAIPEYVGNVLDPNNKQQVLQAIIAMIEARVGDYALDTGVANAYVIALNPAITAYTGNFFFAFKAAHANAGASTVDFGAGPVALNNDVGGALAKDDITAGMIVSGNYSLADNQARITSMVRSQINTIAKVLSPAGTIISWGGQTAPAGYLQCPTALSYISATTYSELAFAIGSTWGGSGSTNAGAFTVGHTYVIQTVGTTNFMLLGAANNNVGTVFTATGIGAGTGAVYSQIGLPYCPTGYALVQGAVGVATVGNNLAHTHIDAGHSHAPGLPSGVMGGGTGFVLVNPADNNGYISSQSGNANIQSSGGAANLPAGMGVMYCIKY